MAFDWQQCFADLRLRYEGTYLRVAFPKTPNKREIFYVGAVGQGNENHPFMEMHNSQMGKIVLNYQSECDIYFDYPKPGYFFHQDRMALLFYRIHLRQNKRGLSKQTGQFVSPYGGFFGGEVFSFNEEVVTSAFEERHFPTLPQAISLLEGSALSVPLSSDLALGIHPDAKMGDAYLLWYQTQPIGYYRNGFLVEESQFYQEVLDYVTHKGLHETPVRAA